VGVCVVGQTILRSDFGHGARERFVRYRSQSLGSLRGRARKRDVALSI